MLTYSIFLFLNTIKAAALAAAAAQLPVVNPNFSIFSPYETTF